MSDVNPGERRIVNRLQPPSKMPVLGIRWADGTIPLGLGVLGIFLGSFLGVGGLQSLLVGALGVSIGFLLVYLSPSSEHVTTTDWLTDGVHYLRQPARIYSASPAAPSAARNEGGLQNKTPFAPDTRTEDLVGIKRAWTGAGVVLRSDSRMEAALEVDAPNMQFARSVDWEHLQQQGKRAANDLFVNYPELKLHVTTEPFAIDTLIQRLEDRLADPDLQHRDVFYELVSEYKEHRPRDLQERGTQRVRTFLIVSVDVNEAATEYLGDRTPTEKLAHLPLIGLFLPSEWRGAGGQTDMEMYAEMADAAHDRLEEIQADLYTELPGHSVRRLSTIELITLGARFWNGTDEAYHKIDRVVRNQPVMRAASDVAPHQEPAREQSASTDGGDPQ